VVVGDRASEEAPLRKLAPLELRDLEGNVAGPLSANAHDVGPRDARPEAKATASGGAKEAKTGRRPEERSPAKSGDRSPDDKSADGKSAE